MFVKRNYLVLSDDPDIRIVILCSYSSVASSKLLSKVLEYVTALNFLKFKVEEYCKIIIIYKIHVILIKSIVLKHLSNFLNEK